MTLITLYLISVLPSFGNAITGLSVIALTVSCCGAFAAAVEERKKILETCIIVGGVSVFFFLLGVLIPSTSQMYLIAGGCNATNNEELNKRTPNDFNSFPQTKSNDLHWGVL